jgi:hypothetical protein
MVEIVYQKIDDDELRRMLQAAATGDPALAHIFFARFDYNIYLQNQQFLLVHDRTIPLLQKLQLLDTNAYARIHKGVPFYFTAISSFFLHNYTHAVYFFDAAVSEDLRNDPGSRTPAIMFLEMDGDPPNQAARQLTQIAEGKLQSFIDQYNRLPNVIHTTVQEIRDKFLSRAVGDRPEWRTMATSLNSFLLEWDYLAILQGIRVADGTWEPFFTHLFKGCVLFESLIKANPKVVNPGGTLGNIIRHPAIKLNLNIHRDLRADGPAFSNVLCDLPNALNDIEKDMEITVRLRNTIGHNIGLATPMTSDQYIQLISKVMNSIIHTIAGLY